MNVVTYIACVVAGGAILLTIQRLLKRWQEEKSLFTGEWGQIIFAPEDPGERVEKLDTVSCKHRGDIVTAVICRIYPTEKRHKIWIFTGRYRNGNLFGHFWSKRRGDPSAGTIFLRQVDEDEFAGFYVRMSILTQSWDVDTVSIQRIPLKWKKLKDGESITSSQPVEKLKESLLNPDVGEPR